MGAREIELTLRSWISPPRLIFWKKDENVVLQNCYFYNRISSKTDRRVVQKNSAISLALIAARSVFHLTLKDLKAMWNTFSACLACSAEGATEAISLALHSVSHRLKARWNTRETLWSARERASVALSAEQERRHTNVFHSALMA